MHEEHFTIRLTARPGRTRAIDRIRALLKLAEKGYQIECHGIEAVDGLSGEPVTIESTGNVATCGGIRRG